MSTDFLPGVTPPQRTEAPINPGPVSAGDEVVSARRAATFRDLFDGLILFALDLTVLTWPEARLPWVTRRDSIAALILFHIFFLSYCMLTRKIPQWRARRIAATWSAAERHRFRGL
ncbi:MAG: hypothetical protein ABI718_12205 [Acidobacteriota bacterium]